MVLVQLVSLEQRFLSVPNVRREIETPRLAVENDRNLRPQRYVSKEFNETRAVLSASPLPLFLLLDVAHLSEPWRVEIHFRATPITLVKRVQTLGKLHPDSRILSRLQDSVTIPLAFSNCTLDALSTALVASLTKHREGLGSAIKDRHIGRWWNLLRCDQNINLPIFFGVTIEDQLQREAGMGEITFSRRETDLKAGV